MKKTNWKSSISKFLAMAMVIVLSMGLMSVSVFAAKSEKPQKNAPHTTNYIIIHKVPKDAEKVTVKTGNQEYEAQKHGGWKVEDNKQYVSGDADVVIVVDGVAYAAKWGNEGGGSVSIKVGNAIPVVEEEEQGEEQGEEKKEEEEEKKDDEDGKDDEDDEDDKDKKKHKKNKKEKKEEEPMVIEEVEVPLASEPAEEIVEIPETVEIPEADVPMAVVPKTSDSTGFWAVMMLLSGTAAAGMLVATKRKANG